jgi:REP element-mobilizing transposase RayT
MFESRADIELFLDAVATAVREEGVEIHAYCILSSHFHLLIKSPGSLSRAMKRIQCSHSRWFNRSRGRDGPLVRGRFASRLIKTERYLNAVLGYIDLNPVRAGMATRPTAYRYGSAHIYATSTARVPWLERSWVEAEACAALGTKVYEPSRYEEAFHDVLPEGIDEIVEARWESGSTDDPLDDLVGSAPDAIRLWMVKNAALADGTRPGLPVLSIDHLARVIGQMAIQDPMIVGKPPRDGWRIALVGLARTLCGSRGRDLGARLGVTEPVISRLHKLHNRLLIEDATYAERVARVASAALTTWSRSGHSRHVVTAC